MPLDFSSEAVLDFSDQGIEAPDFSASSVPEFSAPAPARSPEEMAIQNAEARKEFLKQGWIQKQEPPDTGTGLAEPFIKFADSLGLSPQTISDAMAAMDQYAARASGEVSNEEMRQGLAEPVKPGKASQIAAGTQQAVVNSLEFFTSPVGILTLGAGALPQALQRGVAGAFVVDMARKTPEQVVELSKAIESGDTERISRDVAGLGLTATFIGAGAKHALGKAPKSADLPELKTETGKVMPRLQPYESEKLIASEPQGIATIPGLSALDPRSTAKMPADQAIIANAYSRAKGETFGAVWAEQASTRYQFKADEAGQVTLADGSKNFLSDIVEGEMRQPGSMPLTPEQKAFVDEWRTIHREALDMLKEENVKGFEVDEAGEFLNINEKSYFPRIATGVRGSEATGTVGGQKPGAKQFYQKQRDYKTEREGAERIIYEPDPIRRVATFVSKVYKAVADTRLANDPALGGRPGKPRFGAEERVHQPAFQGKAFPRETAKRLNEFYGDATPTWLRRANSVSQASKALTFSADMSAPLNQGLVIAFSHPARWAKATAKSWQALLQPKALSKYLAENADLASEFVQAGGTIRRMHDFAAGAEKGTFATKIPVLGKVIERTGRSFETFLDVAKLELWKAYRDATPKNEWSKAVEAIENMVLSGRMEQTGLTPSRAMAERLLLNAPSYYRGGLGLITTAIRGGASGKITRNSLIRFLTGITALHYGIYKMLGLDDDDILRRLNPASGKFFKVPITLSTGEGLEVGFSNYILRLMRLTGDSVEEATNDKPIGSGAADNFFVRWVRGMFGPLPGLATDIVTGTSPTGQEITATDAAWNRLRPISAQPFSDKEASLKERLVDAAVSFFGLNAFEQSHRQMFFEERERVAKATYGSKYETLGIGKQAQINRRLQRDPRFKKPEPTQRVIEMALKTMEERRDRLTKSLTDDNQKKLSELGLSITGYRPEIRIGDIEMPLTAKQQERYEALIVDGYNKVIAKLPTTVTNLPIDQREKFFHGLLASQKRVAQLKFIRENR